MFDNIECHRSVILLDFKLLSPWFIEVNGILIDNQVFGICKTINRGNFDPPFSEIMADRFAVSTTNIDQTTAGLKRQMPDIVMQGCCRILCFVYVLRMLADIEFGIVKNFELH